MWSITADRVGALADWELTVCEVYAQEFPKPMQDPATSFFFQGTYDTTGASHVGIYVGNNMMIHCGDVRPDRTKVEVDERGIDEGTTPQG